MEWELLRFGFSVLDVLVPVKIFQFSDMHNENRFLRTFPGHNIRPITKIIFSGMKTRVQFITRFSKFVPVKLGIKFHGSLFVIIS